MQGAASVPGVVRSNAWLRGSAAIGAAHDSVHISAWQRAAGSGCCGSCCAPLLKGHTQAPMHLAHQGTPWHMHVGHFNLFHWHSL